MKKIIQQLQNLDFTQYEAKAYLSLLRRGKITGYELAKNSGVPASKIYQVLNRLLDKDIIVALDSEPKKYAPIPPEEVLSRYRGDYLKVFNDLDRGLNRIYKSQQSANNYIWNISGRAAIIRRVIEFIDQADRQVHLSIWDEEIAELEEGIYRANEKGVEFYIVHYGKQNLGIGNEYRHGREHQIRQERGARRIALEVDEKKVLLGHFLEDGSSNALWTSNKGLVLLAKDYIIHDIYTIRMAEIFGQAANEIFESH
jgi:sugar-specific transcriptional regulator TrmB